MEDRTLDRKWQQNISHHVGVVRAVSVWKKSRSTTQPALKFSSVNGCQSQCTAFWIKNFKLLDDGKTSSLKFCIMDLQFLNPWHFCSLRCAILIEIKRFAVFSDMGCVGALMHILCSSFCCIRPKQVFVSKWKKRNMKLPKESIFSHFQTRKWELPRRTWKQHVLWFLLLIFLRVICLLLHLQSLPTVRHWQASWRIKFKKSVE